MWLMLINRDNVRSVRFEQLHVSYCWLLVITFLHPDWNMKININVLRFNSLYQLENKFLWTPYVCFASLGYLWLPSPNVT